MEKDLCRREITVAKYCNQCGRLLNEGEICQCKKIKYQSDEKMKENGWEQGNQAEPEKEAEKGYAKEMAKEAAKEAAKELVKETIQRRTSGMQADFDGVSTEDWVPFRKLLGLGDSDKNDTRGCFERGKRIVPDLIAPAKGEIPVRQYHVCNVRARAKGLWQEGRVQVTNKRVLCRLSGRSFIGREQKHMEFQLDQIAGISLVNGTRFSVGDLIFGLLLSMIMIWIGTFFGRLPVFLAYVLAVASAAPFFMLKKKFFVKILSLSAGIGSAVWAMNMTYSEFAQKLGLFLSLILLILVACSIALFSMKPGLSFTVTTKCDSAVPVSVVGGRRISFNAEILPGDDAEKMGREIGSMIEDLQKYGDEALKKWKA